MTISPTTSKFVADLETRISVLNRMIEGAKGSERRALQRERADLEEKLQKARANAA